MAADSWVVFCSGALLLPFAYSADASNPTPDLNRDNPQITILYDAVR